MTPSMCLSAGGGLCTGAGASHTPSTRSRTLMRPVTQRRGQLVAVQALGDSTNKTSRGTLRREDEPEEYWSSQSERDGKNPLQDPLAQIGILAILFPFLFLAVAIAFGWVDLSGGRL